MVLKNELYTKRGNTMQIKYLIGEFSDITGISKRMLRHYDKLDLFRPIALDDENGYRYYSEDQIVELNRIQFLRDLGFTLLSIKELLSNPISLSDFLETLKEKEVILTRESDEIKSSLLLAKRTILHLENQSPQTFPSLHQLLDMKGSMMMKEKQSSIVTKVDLKQLMNRDMFVEKIEEILASDQQDHYHFITFDIDNFMHVNDFYGYEVGDSVIQNIISMIIHSLKPAIKDSINENLIARLGGDECSIFLKNANNQKVLTCVDQAFNQIRAFDFTEIGCSKKVTVSCGIAHGKKPEHVTQLKDVSAKAMIEAKRNGRDQYLTMEY